MFLIAVSIITKSGSEVEFEESIVNASNYLSQRIDYLKNEYENINRIKIFMRIEERILMDLSNLIHILQNNAEIYQSDFDFKKIINLFYMLNFRFKFFDIIFTENIFKILFYKYKNKLIDINLLHDEFYQDIIKKGLLLMYLEKYYFIKNKFKIYLFNDSYGSRGSSLPWSATFGS